MSDRPKRPGRRPIDPDATSTRVNLTLSAKHYDRIFQHAQTKAISVPEAIRRLTDRHLRDKSN